MCLVAWPSNESEAGVDMVFINLCYYIDDAVLILINGDLHKSSEVCLLQPHFHSKARQVSTAVKWSIRKFI